MKSPDKISTNEAASLLGYSCNKSALRILKQHNVQPLPCPRRPLHWRKSEVMAVREGSRAFVNRW